MTTKTYKFKNYLYYTKRYPPVVHLFKLTPQKKKNFVMILYSYFDKMDAAKESRIQ